MVTKEEPSVPSIQLRTPTSLAERPDSSSSRNTSRPKPRLLDGQDEIYYGSYSRRRHGLRSSIANSSALSTPAGSAPPSPRVSLSQIHLQDLIRDIEPDQDNYGLEELRDGFFDGYFPSYTPSSKHAEEYLKNDTARPFSFQRWSIDQVHLARNSARKITQTRSGIKLAKSFLSFFIAYIICLIPVCDAWLGRYSYLMPLSVLVNHAGRTVGAQIDGCLMTVLGGALGLGWGSLALYVSTSTVAARAGYGGVLAAFLVPFTAFISFVRCDLIRFYQAVLSAGIAISYVCLADPSQFVSWRIVWDFGIPWSLGQVIGLIVCMTLIPDAGARPFAVALHNAIAVLQKAVALPRNDSPQLRRDISWTITHLSEAVRDLTIDLSVTRFRPTDAQLLRNSLQGALRSVLAIKPDTKLFDVCREDHLAPSEVDGSSADQVVSLIAQYLAEPTKRLIDVMLTTVETSDAVLMTICGHRKHLGPSPNVSADITAAIQFLETALQTFDAADERLLRDPRLPDAYSNHVEVVELLLFVHPVKMTAERIKSLATHIADIKDRPLSVYLPSYPFVKSLSRSNAQVRHDRGGLGAGFYFRSKIMLQRTMKDLYSRPYLPHQHRRHERGGGDEGTRFAKTHHSTLELDPDLGLTADHHAFRYRVWDVLHSLQGFETRFALKMVITTTTLAIPAWLPESRSWYTKNESWWAVVTVWLMMHPRIGGDFQDLITRLFTAFLGALWAGFAYAADDGNPYVIAIFSAIFMIPMVYRYSQSSHPRSGLAGCISFTVVSLSAYNEKAHGGIVFFTWTRACAFLAGIAAAVIINWILWPFIARHELRKAESTMLQHLSILYRGVVGKYIYYFEADKPRQKDIERSEMLEGRIREAFVNIRQLLGLTRHEIRLRAPFNPAPYDALLSTLELFFEDLVQVRQFSLHFQSRMYQIAVSNPNGHLMNQSLLSYRRDAVATILMNLYILSGALKTGRPVPRYMPSARMARKRLLERMTELEAEYEAQMLAEEAKMIERQEGAEYTGGSGLEMKRTVTKGKRWANVYQYAFNAALTDIVERIEDLQRITKVIVGETSFELDRLE